MSRKWTAAIVASCLFHAAVAAAFSSHLPAHLIPGTRSDGRRRSNRRQRGRQRLGWSGAGRDERHPGARPAAEPSLRSRPEAACRPAHRGPAHQGNGRAAPRRLAADCRTIHCRARHADGRQPHAWTNRAWLRRSKRRQSRLLRPKAPRRLLPISDSRRSRPQGQARHQVLSEPAKPTRPAARRMARNATRWRPARARSRQRQAMRSNPATAVKSRRSLPAPTVVFRKSIQASARNNARVVFVVMADGSISDIQLAESSGSAELDQFALTLVRKTAPFPPIPSETGKSSWVFKARIGPF